ncbi:MAG: hypothetical protein ACXQTG_05915 [Methanoculleaceae archaeon]
MEITSLRTWVLFYLISFTVLLWALFLTAQGTLLWIGLTFVIVVGGIDAALLAFEIRQIIRRRNLFEDFGRDRDQYRR